MILFAIGEAVLAELIHSYFFIYVKSLSFFSAFILAVV